MIRFECDYAEGCHERILARLQETNLDQLPGYGTDIHSENAKSYIKKLCGDIPVDVHLLVGGTQTNLTVIASVLKPYQGVISADSGHINTHETGAIEATGHKVLAVESPDGKITAAQVQDVLSAHENDVNHEHTVQPGMVYISHPTENGTTYTKAELSAIALLCRKYNIPLFMDGARLGYALVSRGNDLSVEDIASLCDIFYIGGTKVGAMMGEAVVISNDLYKKDFRYMIKQRGGMLAKGRFLGIQFETLFEDRLYFELSAHAVNLGMKIRSACEAKGYKMYYDSVTNQQFPILPKEKIQKLLEKYAFFEWMPVDEHHSAVRFCTSWATKESHVDALIADL